ncbi:MAG: hypothetical protein GX444_14670 [Myxococcales bacterium]|nr:hypothetical protein [Myxococcales bacterium]
MGGYIDMHTHLLPGFDDGAKEAAESLEILFQARQAGFDGIAVTPHVMVGVYEPTRAAVDEAIRLLLERTRLEMPGLVLHPGAEYYLDDHFYQRLEAGRIDPLAGGTHVLVELPLLKLPPLTKEFAFRIRIKGFVPILAHPERYADVGREPRLAEMLTHAGYRLQINLGSLTGMYGRKARKAAEWMLKHELVDFVGSDAHTPKQAMEAFGAGLEELRELVGEAELDRLLIANPAEALGGKET